MVVETCRFEARRVAYRFFKDGLFGAPESIEKAKQNYARAYWRQEEER